MKIVIDQNIPFINGVFENVAEVQYFKGQNIDNQSVKDADALIIRTRTKCGEALLYGSKVRFIATATAGTDHIDFDFCEKNGIEIYSAAGCNASSVAQYLGSAIGEWSFCNNLNISDLTVGIVGWGNVGKEVENLCNALKIKVLLNDEPLKKLGMAQVCNSCLKKDSAPIANRREQSLVSLQTIAENCDIITFHTPLTFEDEFATKYLANAAFFNSLKRKPLIINAARGGVVNEQELLKAYENGKIAGFALDCWENEPSISPELLQKAFIATPHIAGYSLDGKKNATEMCVQTVSRFFNLGLNDFFVKNFSAKKIIHAKNNELLKILCENYDIKFDSDRLQQNPQKFEDFRNNYYERREIEIITR
ncbi:MAG: 4-phosphoerythronate dehydrogenase [Prevotellaceae bacterium]|jgi:erythronate-4-phosphate dehydrogenase|nr:4-phosphoerythronate dehydrogenase [Prevotellaceae bacterium]